MKNNSLTYLITLLLIILSSCGNHRNVNNNNLGFPEVFATVQTEMVSNTGDAADDPAVWYNSNDPSKSKIIGTDKQGGIAIYNLNGQLESFAAVGKINNCDIQYNFIFGKDTFDIVGGSNRTDNSISIYKLNKKTFSIDEKPIITIKVKSAEVYGFCFYRPVNSKQYYVISVGKDGILEQYRVYCENNQVSSELIWKHKVGTQCEGLVADNENEILYVGEENFAIWKYMMNNNSDHLRYEVVNVINNPNIVPDIEGLTLYCSDNNKGYLIASSQGNNSYAVFERDGNNDYIGSFRIADSDSIDGTSETDGIDVTNLNLGPLFPNGVFIAQDGYNKENGKDTNQNFKLVPWEQIANSFENKLIIDNSHNVK